ncbi:uncharacterized protein TOT_020000748 [Theileria orientalis strain Shintoku]|uniref:Tubulin-tyrosine ligase n=1 Tax=Theileria orientalis strain Shintoku TaxID=869250 RepID=J4C8B4_THEOR|nr:uncharacterized protein TOT_020000748 [Theileria orientalis strain Shintoku]BAM40493.1 uncharacterized protein TOT_020000748 [Theileria orientalis strain Shintoku]|eukprot:XP_009690794.1 uncharacterized protein TOT_020000748 [Theileria orientalis strain Shintoku]
MMYSGNGVRDNASLIKRHKSLQIAYTFEKKLLINKDDNYANDINKNGAVLKRKNSRRSDQAVRSNGHENNTFNCSADDETDMKIARYIDGIILTLSNEDKYSKNNRLRSSSVLSSKPKNTTLNKLLSTRLCEIVKIKESCKCKEKEGPTRKTTFRISESCAKQYHEIKPVLNLSEARNDSSLLNSCLKSLKWKGCSYNAGDIYWFGFSISFNQMCDMISRNKCVSYSRMMINKYPDMNEITKKSYFYHLLNTYSVYLGDDQWFPKSFSMPEDLKRVLHTLEKDVPLIFKPSNGSMGHGVKLVTVPHDITDEMLLNYTAQEYIARPLLLNGKKFDIRVYLLLIGETRAFIYKNSLVRVCTEEYSYPSKDNSKNNFIHLTNYSINKSNVSSYHRGDLDDERNNKQLLFPVLDNLEDVGYDKKEIWNQIVNICSLVCGTVGPEIHLNSRLSTSKSKNLRKMPGYFQILGLDVIIDSYGKAWLLEVNSCPSLKTSYFDGKNFKEDSVDLRVKVPLVTGALNLVHQYEFLKKSKDSQAMNFKDGPNLSKVRQTPSNVADTENGGIDKNHPTINCENIIDDIDDDWEEVGITGSGRLENLMRLFKIAKRENWETNTLSKREWISFCTSGGITDLASLIMIIMSKYTGTKSKPNISLENKIAANCESDVLKNESYMSGKNLVSQMFSESVGRHGREGERRICFSYFVYILGQISKLVEKWIKKTQREIVYNMCEKYKIMIKLDELDWKTYQPHKSSEKIKVEVTEDLLNLLNHNFNL